MLYMTGIALPAPELSDAPRLRLLSCDRGATSAAEARPHGSPKLDRPAPHLVSDAPASEANPILVAGRDPAQRAAVLEELSQSLPQDTTFEQAGAFWEVLVRAPSSRMVVLSGALDDLPTLSLMRMLGHRHPGLPVVSLDVPALAEL